MTTRKRILFRTLLLSLLVAAWSPAQALTWDVKENCDMPAISLQDLKAPSREDCQKICADSKDCKGLVYITGWKKCLLKADVNKKARLRFISGEIGSGREYAKGSFHVDSDHNGKDLQRLVLDEADSCGQACATRSDCAAFTYLEGYHVCWLKKAGGHLTQKVFSCSIRKD